MPAARILFDPPRAPDVDAAVAGLADRPLWHTTPERWRGYVGELVRFARRWGGRDGGGEQFASGCGTRCVDLHCRRREVRLGRRTRGLSGHLVVPAHATGTEIVRPF